MLTGMARLLTRMARMTRWLAYYTHSHCLWGEVSPVVTFVVALNKLPVTTDFSLH